MTRSCFQFLIIHDHHTPTHTDSNQVTFNFVSSVIYLALDPLKLIVDIFSCHWYVCPSFISGGWRWMMCWHVRNPVISAPPVSKAFTTRQTARKSVTFRLTQSLETSIGDPHLYWGALNAELWAENLMTTWASRSRWCQQGSELKRCCWWPTSSRRDFPQNIDLTLMRSGIPTDSVADRRYCARLKQTSAWVNSSTNSMKMKIIKKRDRGTCRVKQR